MAKGKRAGKKAAKKVAKASTSKSGTSNYPRHTLEKALRIPGAMLAQNAGKETSDATAAGYLGITNPTGPFLLEVSSASKYGLLERPETKKLKLTDLALKILKPQNPDDEINGLREAILKAPVISEVYKHYRGENLPDRVFFENTLNASFGIPTDRVTEFIEIFTDSLTKAKLIEVSGDKQRIVNISSERNSPIVDTSTEFRKLSKAASITAADTCFVMMPFAPPLGDYFGKIYEPAITKAGLKAMRADDDIFGTGKIIDQIWNGIHSAKVLIAELTNRNPNVYYELGLAHALKKPVVLVCSNEQDVPFDLKHIRVIYYDMHDPFWGEKLIDKVAENILSAISNPNETILFP